MEVSLLDDGRPIRARINPLFMTVLMAFPLIWVIGLPAALVQDRVDPLTAIFTLVLFVAPVAALIVNFFWHYRLELTLETLSIHRYFRWGGKSIRIEDVTAVVIKPALFGTPRMVFELPRGEIRLMWRGQHGNWWPPIILDRMLARLASRGVYVAPEVRDYLVNRQAHEKELSKTALAVVLGWIAVSSLVFTVAVTAGVTGDPVFAVTLTAITVPFLAAGYAFLAAIFWLNERHYGDLPPPTDDQIGVPAA